MSDDEKTRKELDEAAKKLVDSQEATALDLRLLAVMDCFLYENKRLPTALYMAKDLYERFGELYSLNKPFYRIGEEKVTIFMDDSLESGTLLAGDVH